MENDWSCRSKAPLLYRKTHNTRSYTLAQSPSYLTFSADDGDEIAQFRRLIQSKEFIAYLQEVTGLTLTHAQNGRECVCRVVEPHVAGEARKFSSGCYTMVHDNVAQHSEEGLDILFGLHNPGTEPLLRSTLPCSFVRPLNRMEGRTWRIHDVYGRRG